MYVFFSLLCVLIYIKQTAISKVKNMIAYPASQYSLLIGLVLTLQAVSSFGLLCFTLLMWFLILRLT